MMILFEYALSGRRETKVVMATYGLPAKFFNVMGQSTVETKEKLII